MKKVIIAVVATLAGIVVSNLLLERFVLNQDN